MSPPTRRTVLAGATALLAGCERGVSEVSEHTPVELTIPAPTPRIGYPHLRSTGNRVAGGTGGLPGSEPTDVPLGAPPTWVAAMNAPSGTAWIVADRSGRLSVVSFDDLDNEVIVTDRGVWPPEGPPVIRSAGDAYHRVIPPKDASYLAPSLALGRDTERGSEGVAATSTDGAVAVEYERTGDRIDADLLPDARLCRLDERRAVALGGPTTDYDHGVLGDSTEAREVVVLDLRAGTVERRISIPDGRVIEGVSPIVADLGGDRAIVVTTSGPADGARLVAYAPDGRRLAAGEPIGQGFRWRHQLAVAPFRPDGGRELAVVRTPHLGGTVEFYRRAGDRLEVVATVPGAASHVHGSRNLDGGLAADADGDGRVELVVPSEDRKRLRGIERRDGGAMAEWSVPIGGRLTSNVVAVQDGSGLAVGAGHGGGTLRVWR